MITSAVHALGVYGGAIVVPGRPPSTNEVVCSSSKSAARNPSATKSKARAGVLVQPEMERRRSPLVSIPPFGRGFSRHPGLPIRCVRKEGGASRSAPGLTSAASEWYLALLRCSASLSSSRGPPVILTKERSLHFQLRRHKYCRQYGLAMECAKELCKD